MTLFLYTTVLEAVGDNEYKKAIANINRMKLETLPKHYLNFLAIVLGWLHYLTRQTKEGNQYFDLVIKHAKRSDAERLETAKHILALKPYSPKGINLLKEITENLHPSPENVILKHGSQRIF